jgi:signal transduction histidine kinase
LRCRLAYYTIAKGIIAGICFGFGIIFLFSGLRRRGGKRLNLLFAVFALAYAATLFNGIRFHNAVFVEAYVAIIRQDTIFVVLAFTALIWYVAEYTQVKPLVFLWGLTGVFVASGVAQLVRTNLIYDQITGLNAVTMPWGEQVAYLEANDSVWSLLFLAAQLAVLGFSVLACIRQYQLGQRSEALILSIGVLWFVAALGAELLGQAGVITPIFYGEFGFLGFIVALSLQMSNEVIKTEEELTDYRLNLEDMVKQRTAELEEAQEKMLQQAQQTATAEERSRLARELHDAVTQTIYSATLIVEALPQVWERDPDEGRRNLAKLRQLVRGALAEMRTLLFELRPVALEHAELETLLRQLADALTGRTRLPVVIEMEGQADPPAEVKIACYRITQEAFNNIAKHAEADRVNLTVRQSSDQINLAISDNGRGFDPGGVAANHMGLVIMRERAESIGAELNLQSAAGQGAQIHLSWTKGEGVS